MNLFYQPLIPKGVLHLDEEESRHCIKVLRRKSGDPIRLTDGLGYFYDAIITNDSFRQCTFSIKSKELSPPRPFSIHIAISPTKNADRIEWFVEKSVELGVDQITLMVCEHTERNFLKTDRLTKMAVSAMKQSLKARLPGIAGPVAFADVVNGTETKKYIAYVEPANPVHLQQQAPPSSDYLILIGPEGDFSEAEIQQALSKGFTKVSLGPSRLRTETAGLAACHILNLINT